MSEVIPEDIMKAAAECFADVRNCVTIDDASDYPGLDWDSSSATEWIARAILAERERCAKVAEGLASNAVAFERKHFDRPSLDFQRYREGCNGVATAIRQA